MMALGCSGFSAGAASGCSANKQVDGVETTVMERDCDVKAEPSCANRMVDRRTAETESFMLIWLGLIPKEADVCFWCVGLVFDGRGLECGGKKQKTED